MLIQKLKQFRHSIEKLFIKPISVAIEMFNRRVDKDISFYNSSLNYYRCLLPSLENTGNFILLITSNVIVNENQNMISECLKKGVNFFLSDKLETS